MPNFENMGSADDTSTWDLTPMDTATESGRKDVEHYVSPEIEEWRRANGFVTSPDGAQLEVLGGEKGDWLVNPNDNTQVEAADNFLKGSDASGWTLQ